jgi:salicylate hydroxylase
LYFSKQYARPIFSEFLQQMAAKRAIIIGGGVAGPASALALSKIGITCTIYELREGAATIGGAINLTPNALRVLDHFGVLEKAMECGCPCEKIEMFSVATGRRLGELPFGSVELHGYSSLRICRTDLQQLMLSAVQDAGIEVQYNKKLTAVEEAEDSITAIFEDGTSASADILLGCDGIHSAVRTQFVEPSRRPTYTGVSTVYGIIPTSAITEPIPFSATAINSSRSGSLLTSYCNAAKTSIFLAAVMEVAEQQGEDGWRVRGKIADDTRRDLLRRFESEKLPCVVQMTNATDDLYFFPVFTLDYGGMWSRGRAILIGDAAHAVSSLQPFTQPSSKC